MDHERISQQLAGFKMAFVYINYTSMKLWGFFIFIFPLKYLITHAYNCMPLFIFLEINGRISKKK